MPAFYIDHNVPVVLAHLLVARGYPTGITRDEGLASASDDHQLMHAAQTGRVLITFNRKDFRLLHQAWCRWTQTWEMNPCPLHAGVLILNQLPAEQIAVQIDELLDRQVNLPNQLYDWQTGSQWRWLTPTGDLAPIA